jgi:preprotein translocase subunit YajC
MIKNNILKFSAIFIVLILTATSLFGINSVFWMDSAYAEYQPYNSFDKYDWGGVSGKENDRYGWNMTYINSINNDNYVDLVIGAPWYDGGDIKDTGAVFIFYGKAETSFQNLNYSAADVVISGDFYTDLFGWDVADAGDVNNDGHRDMIVGAPGAQNNHGCAYIIHGGALTGGNYKAAEVSARVLSGHKLGLEEDALYGSSVSGIGDVNNDGYSDVLVGAPGDDLAVITYGYKSKMTLYPDLWDDDESSKGIITFDEGVNNGANDLNTWGLDGDDDGWDWIDSFSDPTGLYGHTTPAPYDSCTIYAPLEQDGPDADGPTWKNKTALEIMVGRNHTHLNPYGDGWDWDPGTSAAWGIEFAITPTLYDYISGNSSIELSFDYEAWDASRIYNNSNLSRRFIYTIRSRFWNSSEITYLGDVDVNDETYVFYKQDNWNVPPWGPVYNNYKTDITDHIDGVGSYYWDFGCYFDRSWSTRYDDGIMALFDNITMKITNEKNIFIHGVKNSGFGSSVASIGDVNDDGYPDMMVSAPNVDGGHVVLIQGKKMLKTNEYITQGMVAFTGENYGDKFGNSISTAGDVDNDGTPDMVIGAPGGNYANLYYGETLATIKVPDLSEKNSDKQTAYLEFDAGLKSTGNTPGITAPDDGWDTWNGVYGYESGNTAGSAVKYNGADGIDSEQVAADSALTVTIGYTEGGGSWDGAQPDSGGYGVKFKVTEDMYEAISAGGSAVISYDWSLDNKNLDQGDGVWIKSSLRSDNTNLALGWDLDYFALAQSNKDDSNETYWTEEPQDMSGIFIQDCTDFFTKPGWYYFDIGAKLSKYEWTEDVVVHFDNLCLRINPKPDVKFVGPDNSGFGFSVGYSDKLNADEYSDIVIGSPFYDSENGENSGAVFGFIMELDSLNPRPAGTAEFITFGENPGDNFGWTLLATESLDSDEFCEIIASAINYDSDLVDTGRVYLFSISKGPKIRIIDPVGTEPLSGEVLIKALVTDPDSNIDLVKGIYFYYSTDLANWNLIGSQKSSTGESDIMEISWNTTELLDGDNYYIKGWVRDLDLNMGENITMALTIDNFHKPELEFKSPKDGDTVSGTVNIKVHATDSELDMIGGGINTTSGVLFSYSEDNENWEPLGTKYTAVEDVYSIDFDTNPKLDGEYFLKVNASDLDGFELEEVISVQVDNPGRVPSITLLTSLDNLNLSGKVTVSAAVFDFDRDINSSGVTFYVQADDGKGQWIEIGSDAEPNIKANGTYKFSLAWDTTLVDDFWYRLKAVVTDSENLTNETMTQGFIVHNNENNPPVIDIISPIPGEIITESKMVIVRVRDLEDDIDANGVDYFHSTDKVDWRYFGSVQQPRPTDKMFYDFLWQSTQVPDGRYWLNVSVSDNSGLKSWYITEDTVFVHNSMLNPPVVKILGMEKGMYVNGTFNLHALAEDLENNINEIGVMFYYSMDGDDWTIISNVQSPLSDESNIYQLSWDTSLHTDGKYWLMAEVTDNDGLKASESTKYFYIHNTNTNRPVVKYLGPNSGELKNVIILNATVFDLENNVNQGGVKFYFSTDNQSWQLIGSDTTGEPSNNDLLYYELFWDTNYVSDDRYWLKVEVEDLTNLKALDFSSDSVMIHNRQTNPPRIEFKQPRTDVPLPQVVSIVVEVQDFDDDVDLVVFYFSKDNITWVVIDTLYNPGKQNTYNIMWNTEKLYNGDYYLKVKAIDEMGNEDERTIGTFEVSEGKEPKQDAKQEFPVWIVVIIIIVLVMVVIISLLIRRGKRREEELIKEVSEEMQKTQIVETEVEYIPDMTAVSQNELANSVTPTLANNKSPQLQPVETAQSYLSPLPTVNPVPELPPYEPEVETIESYKKQMDRWKAEGYNVSKLESLLNSDETMFAHSFPEVSANISRLKNISGKLKSMNTAGYEVQVDSIKSKLYIPDQAEVEVAVEEFKALKLKLGVVPRATPVNSRTQIDDILPQLLPEEPTTVSGAPPEPMDPIQEDVPPDFELPPDLDLPMETHQPEQEIPISPFVAGSSDDPGTIEEDIPESPFSAVQTQTMEDELNGHEEIIEIPEDE